MEQNLGPYLAEHLTDEQTAFALAKEEAPEKRRDHRFPVNERAWLHWFNPVRMEKTPVQILDVSRNGLRLATSTPMEVGSMLQIAFSDMFVLGEVLHCDPGEDAFYSGIRIETVFRRVHDDSAVGTV